MTTGIDRGAIGAASPVAYGPDPAWVFAVLGVAVFVAGLASWWWVTHRPRRPVQRRVGCLGPDEPAPYGASGYVTDAGLYLQNKLLALEPGTQWGGTYANKPGYHNTRTQNSPSDYSVVDKPPDNGGPGNKAAAFDWTFPEAHGGDYRRIARYTSRLLASAKDQNDPRLNGWREFYGQSDSDSEVEGWDCRYGYACTSDSSHLWHIHLSESRDQTESIENKDALLSVLRGETVDQWRASQRPPTTPGGGHVLLNCPFDPTRQDLFYVGPRNEVYHSWWAGGMTSMWAGDGATENLGGNVVQGTLTAQWTADGDAVYVAGLGAATPDAPANSGTWWGCNVDRYGNRSGWGSFEGVHGVYPPYAPTTQVLTATRDWVPLVLGVIAVLASVFGLVVLAVTQ